MHRGPALVCGPLAAAFGAAGHARSGSGTRSGARRRTPAALHGAVCPRCPQRPRARTWAAAPAAAAAPAPRGRAQRGTASAPPPGPRRAGPAGGAPRRGRRRAARRARRASPRVGRRGGAGDFQTARAVRRGRVAVAQGAPARVHVPRAQPGGRFQGLLFRARRRAAAGAQGGAFARPVRRALDHARSPECSRRAAAGACTLLPSGPSCTPPHAPRRWPTI